MRDSKHSSLHQQKRFAGRIALAALALMPALTVPVFAQATSSNTATPAKDKGEGEYSLVDVGAFGGWQWFQVYQGTSNAVEKLESGIYVGGRVTENLARYFSLEQFFAFANNRADLQPAGNSLYATVPEHNETVGLLAEFYFTPRDAKVRPYLFIGPGYLRYGPGSASSINPPSSGPFTAASLQATDSAAFLYGLGIKMNVAKRVAIRADLTGKLGREAHFALPTGPTFPGDLYVPKKNGASALAVSLGVDFRTRLHEPPVAAAPPPPPAPAPAPVPALRVRAITGAHDVCAGDDITLSSGATGGAPGSTIMYQWMVNGQNVPNANGTTFNLPTAGSPGSKTITLRATEGNMNATSDPVTVNVRPLLPPTIQLTGVPGMVEYGAPAIQLAATTNAPNQCNGRLMTTYSGPGVSGSTFDPSAVGGFDPSNRLKQQTRMVTLTATVTDEHRQSASANANVTVTLKPAASRKDVVFPNGSARVNNAAKRYLIEELTPRLRDDPNSSVILIGHRDTNERAANLDRRRMLNVAAVLSAGKGVCPALDLSRIQVTAAGTTQTSTPEPFADSSVRERSGQGVSATDQRAPFRRVEVWFVPGGADRPAVAGLEPAPVKQIQALGCPR